jgi:hypothetical protein
MRCAPGRVIVGPGWADDSAGRPAGYHGLMDNINDQAVQAGSPGTPGGRARAAGAALQTRTFVADSATD